MQIVPRSGQGDGFCGEGQLLHNKVAMLGEHAYQDDHAWPCKSGGPGIQRWQRAWDGVLMTWP